MTDYVSYCQWPGCGNIAVSRSARGMQMKPLNVCEEHLLEMRRIPDVEAWRISRERQPVRRSPVNRHAYIEGERIAPDDGIALW